MPGPLLLAGLVLPQVLGMVQTGMMMHTMSQNGEKTDAAMKSMLAGGQNATQGIGGVTGAPVEGQQGYQALA